MRLDGKVAIVTGGARGIGRGIVRTLTSAGAQVLATDVDPEGLGQTADLAGERCTTLVADVSQEADWERTVAEVNHRYARLDLLVNNATWYVVAPITEITEADWNRTLHVGLTSVFLGMKHSIPLIEASGGGVILNLASMNQIRYNPGHGAYAAMKAGVVALTKQAALEYGPRGIRCNALSPGFIETERTTMQDPSEQRFNRECYPVGRVGRVEDVARAVLFLAADEAGFITGVDLAVDGGTTLGAIAAYLKPSLRARWLSGTIHIGDDHEDGSAL